MRPVYASFVPLGRVLLASLFILGGINKCLTFSATHQRMVEIGFPMVDLLLPLTILLELGGGILVGIGRWGAAGAGMALVLHIVAVNLIFHRFWDVQGDMAAVELSLFFKNVAVAGGLLFVLGVSKAPTAIRQPA